MELPSLSALRPYLTALPDAQCLSVLYGVYQFGLSVKKRDVTALHSPLLAITGLVIPFIQKKAASAV